MKTAIIAILFAGLTLASLANARTVRHSVRAMGTVSHVLGGR